MHQLQNFQLGGPEKLNGTDDPRHALQKNGGLADFLCLMVATSCATQRWTSLSNDLANANIGAETNLQQKQKSSTTFQIWATLDPEWRIAEVCALATVATEVHGRATLGVAVGPRRSVADELLAKADVIRAVHERVRLCQEPQTKFAFIPESLG